MNMHLIRRDTHKASYVCHDLSLYYRPNTNTNTNTNCISYNN